MANQKNTNALIKNLETQVGEIVKQLANQQGGTFTTTTQTNPKNIASQSQQGWYSA